MTIEKRITWQNENWNDMTKWKFVIVVTNLSKCKNNSKNISNMWIYMYKYLCKLWPMHSVSVSITLNKPYYYYYITTLERRH